MASEFNEFQKRVLAAYNSGDHMVERPDDVESCGDGLLKYLLAELSTSEGCDSLGTSQNRIETSIQQLEEVLLAMKSEEHKTKKEWTPVYSKWRHGGWYVHNVRYPNGGIGCVSNNYQDKKWRIACDNRRQELGGEGDFTFPTRDAAARAELELANALCAKANQTGEAVCLPRKK